jgi:riboflavin kinase/FMN adenylyltransferase
MKNKVIYALGVFDGVHLGHQALLKACRELARDLGCQTGVVTFLSHPDTLVLGRTPGLINTIEDRVRLLKTFGMDWVVALPFDRALRAMPWLDFLRMLELERNAAGFVCGADFRFGHKGIGTAELLRSFCQSRGLPCSIVPEQTLDGIRVSSTHIRTLLEAGDMEAAAAFLGHPHILTGMVVPGQHLGRKLGTPTANLRIPAGTICPRFGVYACRALVEKENYAAVTNVGTRPTVDGVDVTVEPWLLDFTGDLYSREVTLEFHKFLRPEQKFESLDALRSEIRRNALQTRKYFEKK